MSMFNPEKILVIAAHPDDEILGAGGSLARWAIAGADISVLLLGEGPTARTDEKDCARKVELQAGIQAKSASALLGIKWIEILGFPDNRFDTIPFLEITKQVEVCKREIRPDLVLTHFAGDLNIDHAITCRAALTAFRPLPDEKKIFMLGFEVPSSTDYTSPALGNSFAPALYVDISGKYLQRKLNALRVYNSEMRPWPHPRSFEGVENLAKVRGSQSGVDAAEAFIIYRGVI